MSSSLGGITDTLGTQVLSGNTWTDVNGGSPGVSQATSPLHIKSVFGCTGITDYDLTGQVLPTQINYPDGTYVGIQYEGTPGFSGDYTGRLGKLTLREGGTVTYTYSGSNNGINCTYGLPETLKRQTSDGTTTYVFTPSSTGSGTSVTDPAGNVTAYTFVYASNGAPVLTKVARYQGTSTLLTTDVYCYNAASGQPGNCTTAVSSMPITEVDLYHTISGMSTSSRTQTKYDNYGNVTYSAQYGFGASSPTLATTATYGTWNGTSCVAIGHYINNTPCDILQKAGSNNVSESRYTYDAKGNLLTTYVWNGSAWLSNATPNSYNTNGTVATSYDLANQPTTYSYSPASYTQCTGCTNYPFPTAISKGGLTTYFTWNGTGGVKVMDKDGNTPANTTTYGYVDSSSNADPFWRVMSVTDPLNNVAWETYPSGSSPTNVNSSFTFNAGNSIQSTTVTTDAYGRSVNAQIYQSPSPTNYDTVSTNYSWSGNYRQMQSTLPCSTGAGNQCSYSSGTTTTLIDPLGRAYTVTDGGGEVVTKTYTQNDVLTVLSPAPSGENKKQFQEEFDGLGRITKSCAIGNGSITACGQHSGSANGVTTSYSYSYAAGSSTTTATRESQSRSKTFDALGRVTQSVTPEGGTWTYFYDTYSSCPTGYKGANGNLAATKDPNGNLICYSFDSINRVTGVNASGTTCRHFYYDSSTGYSGAIPSGVTAPTNSSGRMVEAATDSCSSGTLITDEWFSYDKNGRMTDMWELTPHSTQYYHSVAIFFENGKVKTLQLASPSLYTMTWGLDGEGRWNKLTDSTTGQTLVTGATFFPAANPAVVSLNGTDNDSYTFDSNTGRMTQFALTVGNTPKTLTGVLSWNQNGMLNKLTITDGFNAGGTQTCHYDSTLPGGKGYDDWGRLLGVDCGSGQWGQTFSYDDYDNLSKSVISGRTGTNWLPGYSSTNNHCTGCTYDSNGDVTGDGNNVYGWNEFSKLKWTATSGTPTCGSGGRCLVYDAFGRIVEQSHNSTWTTRWITQVGETAYMSGTAINYGYWSGRGTGRVLIYGNSAGYDYLHGDWVGNARLDSDLVGRTVFTDQSYSPYGELYDIFGSNVGQNKVFAMMNGNFAPSTTTPIMWDTPNRELSMVGRWLSPDPAGAGWNQYAYATDPNSFVDPSGLDSCWDHSSYEGSGSPPPCPGGGIDSGGGGGDASTPEPTPGPPPGSGIGPGGWMSGGGDPLVQAEASYASWANAMWLAGGSSVTSPVNGRAYSIDWSIRSGAFYVAPNGEALDASDVAELGLTALGAVDTPDYSLGTLSAANNGSFTKAVLPEGPWTNVCKSGQVTFLAPTSFDMSAIVAAGKAGGPFGPFAALAAVGQGGTFDFQRSSNSAGDTIFYSGYTNVANFAVGAYLYGAGYTQLGASTVSNGFALVKSSNAGDPNQALYRNAGYNAAASGGQITCSGLIWAP